MMRGEQCTGVLTEYLVYTAGYRDAVTAKRLAPEEFYSNLPSGAAVVDIRSHAYSPFAPAYTGTGVRVSVERWKPGDKTFIPLRELGNTHRDAGGKRRSPPHYVDAEAGFAKLEGLLREHGSVVLVCACSYNTITSKDHRCHRFFVAEEIAHRMAGVSIVHCEQEDSETGGVDGFHP